MVRRASVLRSRTGWFAWARRWYLVAWDNERQDWRTFRVDRITPRTPTDPRFASRKLPEKSVADFVQHTVGTAYWQYRARVLEHALADYAKAWMPIPMDREVIDDNACIVEVGSDAPHQLALWLGMLDAAFEVVDGSRTGDRHHRAR